MCKENELSIEENEAVANAQAEAECEYSGVENDKEEQADV